MASGISKADTGRGFPDAAAFMGSKQSNANGKPLIFFGVAYVLDSRGSA
jgi:hypothetical protein